MRIIVASSSTPFVYGGATIIADSLVETLRTNGHQVEQLSLPFDPDYRRCLSQMLAFRLLDLSSHGDLLITSRPPSHLLQHPRKVVWFIHHIRGAYDLWGTQYQEIPSNPEGLQCRESIIQADNIALRESTKVFANSREVQARLRNFNQIDAPVLYPPLPHPERYYNAPAEDYILYVSRLVHHKRQWLAIEALRHTKPAVKLVIAGAPDPDSTLYLKQLKAMIHDYGLAHRVTLIPRWISESEKTNLFSRCLASVYIPYREDSYGYPTLESFQSCKPVITTSDAGGTCELVVDGECGLLTAPDPEALAQAMNRLYVDRGLAEQLGANGFGRVQNGGISWTSVLRSLLD